jgi:LAS superfamily LD-carboxypeptidase LdcB
MSDDASVFRPVPVERPGGGRVTDKTPPDPGEIVTIPAFGRPTVPVHHLAAAAWRAMVDAARAAGIEAPLLHAVSGYRSVDEQQWLWQGALAKYGDPEVACLWVARPGTSAHQSGRAIDLHLGDPIESEYVDVMRETPVYRWVVANAERFGFYPYDVEPWHWEYNPPWDGSADHS